MTNKIQQLIDDNRWQPIEEAQQEPLINRFLMLDSEEWNTHAFGCWNLVNQSWSIIDDAGEWVTPVYQPTHFRTLPTDTLADVAQVMYEALERITKPEENTYGDAQFLAQQALTRCNEIIEE